ncbi:hypothetical protein [Terriglobus sp.]|uniref:hypothetical protein n=1 Tax=Terriglobus sp. TaxID=1889013 RepID=UPI003AFFAF69
MRFLRLCTLLAAGSAILCAGAQTPGPQPQRDVFVVGRETAIGNPMEGFRPTRVDLPAEPMDAGGRRDLVRMLLAELGFAHLPLPLGAPGLEMHVNGRLTTTPADLQKRLYEKGMCADRGDRVMITDLKFERDRILIDVNGGPYLSHRFLRHVSINDIPLAGNGQVGERATGTRIALLFEGPVPRVTAAELKSLLEPVLDFGVKSSEQAYADTLPEPIKQAIDEHRILVGMNKRMVLAAAGQPESKLRERAVDSTTGEVFEEWIYGHTPQTIRFVRFRGDRVILLKTGALGKPLETREKDELADYRDPSRTHTVVLGGDAGADDRKAPSLRSDAETKTEDKGTDGKHAPSLNPSPSAGNLPARLALR